MDKGMKDSGFVEKEKVRVIATRKGEELHFTVVEVNGKPRADIRFFVKSEEKGQVFAAKRGISILPRHLEEFKTGVSELARRLACVKDAD